MASSHVGISPVQFPVAGASTVSFVTIDSGAIGAFKLGQRLVTGGEEYVFIHNAMVSAATAGIGMTTSGISGYSLTRSSTAAADVPVCFVKHNDIPAGGYGWGLVRGNVSVHVASAVSAGKTITLDGDGVVGTHLKGSFPTGLCIGKMIDSAAASSQGLAIVRCFG